MPSKKQQTDNDVATDKPAATRAKGFFFSICLAVFILFVLIAAGALLYSRSFRTVQLGNIVVTDKTSPTELTQQIEQQTSSYMLQVSYPDGKQKQFSLEKLGISVDAVATANAALTAQKPANLFARAQWWRKTPASLTLLVNDKKLEKSLQSAITQSSKKPTNARITITNGRAKIAAAKSGVGFTVNGGRDAVLLAVKNLQTTPLQATNQELSPAISKAEAQPVYEKVKTILQQKVVLDIENRRVTVPSAAIGKWIELSAVPSAKTIDLSVNSGKVLKYINEITAPYVQPPRSEVVLKQADGSTKVLVPGKSGVDVVRKNQLASTVAKKVLTAEGITASAAIDYAPFKRINARAYPKWLVVDVTNKRMYAYENTRLVRTFLISAGAPGTPTVLGQYAIRSKVRIQDMRGNNVDGSRYFQPNVEYVNYFYADYAIHGNYWRPASYFGSVNSSHGCVGIRNFDAAWVYGWAPVGTPVIIHS